MPDSGVPHSGVSNSTMPNSGVQSSSAPDPGSSPPGPTSTRSRANRLATWSRRFAPWKAVVVGLLIITGFHVLWALSIPWPTSSMTSLADTVYGRQPFPPPAATWGVVVLLLGAVGVVVGSMRSDLPPLVARLCCIGSLIVVGALMLRGVFGEVASITGLEGSTDRFRFFDIVLYSPFCIWAALGIYYRQPKLTARRTPDSPTNQGDTPS